MNISRNRTIIGLLNTVNVSLAIYSVIITLLFFIGKSEYALFSALILIIPVLSYFLKQLTKYLFSFLLGHVALLYVSLTLPEDIIVKIIFVLFTIIVLLFHLSRRVSSEDVVRDSIPFAHLLVPIVMQIAANDNGFTQLSQMIRIITLISVVMYLITLYLFNFTNFFSLDLEKTNVNLKRLKQINNSLVMMFIVIITAIMTGAFSVPSSKIGAVIKSILLFIPRLLARWLQSKINEEVPKEPSIGDSLPDKSLYLATQETYTPSPIMEVLLQFLTVILILAIIVFAIYGLYQLYNHFIVTKNDDTETKEFISPFFKENKTRKIALKKKVNLPHIFLNNNEKIRRYFSQLVIKNFNGKVPTNLTAEELLNVPVQKIIKLLSNEPYKIDPKLLELYHKARYSKQMCSKEEVNIVKNIVKGT